MQFFIEKFYKEEHIDGLKAPYISSELYAYFAYYYFALQTDGSFSLGVVIPLGSRLSSIREIEVCWKANKRATSLA